MMASTAFIAFHDIRFCSVMSPTVSLCNSFSSKCNGHACVHTLSYAVSNGYAAVRGLAGLHNYS